MEARSILVPQAIQGNLAELARRHAAGRREADEITLFKSVGCLLEDLVAAELCFELATRPAS